jgi:hypothetical protein
VLQGVARACKTRIPRRLSLLRVAECCTVLRSRWYQSGIKGATVTVLQWVKWPAVAPSTVTPQVEEVGQRRMVSSEFECRKVSYVRTRTQTDQVPATSSSA